MHKIKCQQWKAGQHFKCKLFLAQAYLPRMEELNTRELIIEDEFGNLIGDLSLISFVSTPAIDQDFMLFSQAQSPWQFAKLEEEKMIVTGCAMRPNFKMLRQDPKTGEIFNAVFSSAQVEKCSQIFLKNSAHLQTNLEHGQLLGKNEVEGVFVVESWIVSDPANDKAAALGFSDISAGDWYVSFKVANKEFWQFIKQFGGGFSIEGVFNQRLSEAFKSADTEEVILAQIKVIAFDDTKPDSQKEEEIKALINKK